MQEKYKYLTVMEQRAKVMGKNKVVQIVKKQLGKEEKSVKNYKALKKRYEAQIAEALQH